jgi:MFS transporter, YNFM family, putative membrane transport protein
VGRARVLSNRALRRGVRRAPEFVLPFDCVGGKAAVVTPSSTVARFEAPAGDPPLIARGGARFWRVSFALFLGSFATFALLYCVQPLMPAFARAFSISPAAASLSLSAATGVLAVAMVFAGTLSDVLGRKAVMTASLAAAAVATLAASLSPDWTTLVVLRALTGLALSGVPAVAMAYLAEEMDRSAIGLAMGLYIAGNTLGGLGGRLAGAAIADVSGWRGAVAIVGLVSLACAAAFAFALPNERRLPPKTQATALLPAIRSHFTDPGLRYLFALGFLLMGVLVTTYNYIGFRLAAAPFSLSQAAIGLVYSIYLVGAVSSAAMGELAGRYGRRRVIGLAIVLMPIGVVFTLPESLPLMILGVGILTVGFFGGHSIASSWIGLRAETAKAQASALYLFFYYAGSSLAGSIGGWVFALAAWPGVAAFVGAMSWLALVIAMKLARVPPPAHLRAS